MIFFFLLGLLFGILLCSKDIISRAIAGLKDRYKIKKLEKQLEESEKQLVENERQIAQNNNEPINRF